MTARDLSGGADADDSKLREALEVLYLILAVQTTEVHYGTRTWPVTFTRSSSAPTITTGLSCRR